MNPPSKYQTWVEIDLKRLGENLRFLRQNLRPETKIMAVVKADAYGHGAAGVAASLLSGGVDALAVSSVEEGRELRQNGIKAPILVLGDLALESLEGLANYRLTATVSDLQMLSRLNSLGKRLKQKIETHIKFDTGMGDSGIQTKDCLQLITSIRKAKYVKIEGVYTQLSSTYGGDSGDALLQISRFEQVLATMRGAGIKIPLAHAASSPAVLKYPQAEYSMVRTGILLYGLSCQNEMVDGKVKPVMSLKTRISVIKEVEDGFRGGYGWTFTTSRPTRIATLPLGYSDAVYLHFLRQGEVLIHGQRAPVLGRVCMNHFMVDVTRIPEARVGDEVVVIGEQGKEQITAEDIAGCTGIAVENYDCVCLLGRRLPRLYIKPDQVETLPEVQKLPKTRQQSR